MVNAPGVVFIAMNHAAKQQQRPRPAGTGIDRSRHCVMRRVK